MCSFALASSHMYRKQFWIPKDIYRNKTYRRTFSSGIEKDKYRSGLTEQASLAFPFVRACAMEVVDEIVACAAIGARILFTVVNI